MGSIISKTSGMWDFLETGEGEGAGDGGEGDDTVGFGGFGILRVLAGFKGSATCSFTPGRGASDPALSVDAATSLPGGGTGTVALVSDKSVGGSFVLGGSWVVGPRLSAAADTTKTTVRSNKRRATLRAAFFHLAQNATEEGSVFGSKSRSSAAFGMTMGRPASGLPRASTPGGSRRSWGPRASFNASISRAALPKRLAGFRSRVRATNSQISRERSGRRVASG